MCWCVCLSLSLSLCLCMCVCMCVRACVNACVRACMRACVCLCVYLGAGDKVATHEAHCELMHVDSEHEHSTAQEMDSAACRKAGPQMDTLPLQGSELNAINRGFVAPLWTYFVRRIRWGRTVLPSRPSHMKRQCSECQKRFTFRCMQACSGITDGAGQLLRSVRKSDA
jgi:hypothetical protein